MSNARLKVVALALVAFYSTFAAENKKFAINLEVHVRGQQQSASNGPGSARPKVTARVGDALQVKWSAANLDTAAAIPDVTLHVSLDREPKSPNAIYESALVVDFDPGARSTAELLIQAPASGSYVLRVETIGARNKTGEEYAAAMDVVVQ
jgi:hypothetical protein